MSSAQIRDAAADHEDPAAGIAEMLAPLAALWRRDTDALVLVNLETPVAAERRNAVDATPAPASGLRPVHLQAPEYLLAGLARAGVHGVTLANNHALDQEPAGLSETIRACREAGLLTMGAGPYPQHRAPLVLGESGATMAVFSFYDAPRSPALEPGDVAISALDDEAFEQVATADARHDAVVAIVHVLGELLDEPRDEWRVWAQKLADMGADAILVHGTHVPMRVERLRSATGEVPVAWGLGNLLTDMGRQASPRRSETSKLTSARAREGLVARVTLDVSGLALSLLPVFETDDRFVRWHGDLGEGESDFWVRPTLACAPGVSLPDEWPEPWRGEYAAWVSARRDHTFRASGLPPPVCTEDEPAWLDAGHFPR